MNNNDDDLMDLEELRKLAQKEHEPVISNLPPLNTRSEEFLEIKSVESKRLDLFNYFAPAILLACVVIIIVMALNILSNQRQLARNVVLIEKAVASLDEYNREQKDADERAQLLRNSKPLPVSEPIALSKERKFGIFTSDWSNIRTEPDVANELNIVTSVKKGYRVELLYQTGDWYFVATPDDITGWAHISTLAED